MARRLLIVGLVATVITIALVISSVSHIDYHNLSVQQLTAGGYYVYLLPDAFTAPLGWKSRIEMGMGSFTWQCEYSHSTNWNPVEVRYTDAAGKWLFDMYISPQDAVFDKRKATEQLGVDVSWIPTHKGVSYPLSDGTRMQFKDSLDMDVVFSSYLQRDELLSLIAKMQYIGPNVDAIGDPWRKACKNR